MEGTKADVAHNAAQDITVFDELKQRFLEALESENERIKRQAERESASIIAKAEQEAKRIAEEMVTRAREESKQILSETEQRALHIAEEKIKQAESELSSVATAVMSLSEQIVNEAELFARHLSALRMKLEGELKNAQERAQQEAEVVTDATQSARTSGLIEYGNTKEAQNSGYEGNCVPANTHGRKKVLEQTVPAAKQPNARKAGDDKHFVGTLEFSITGGPNSTPLQGLLNHLTKNHGVEVLSTNKGTDGVTKVVVSLRKPIPMLKILKQMASVDDALEVGKDIQIKLAVGPAWVG